jgi:hypothetical protein
MKTRFSILSSPYIHLFIIILLLAARYACQKEKEPHEALAMLPSRAAASIGYTGVANKQEQLVAPRDKKPGVHFRTFKCTKTNINLILNNYK